MSWVKLDDGFAVHRKVRRAGPEGIALFVALLCYCARHGTDGWIAEDELDEAWPWGGMRLSTVATRLVDVGLLERHDGRYLVHDYLEYNESREDRDARKRAAAERAKAYRNRGRDTSVTAHVTRDGARDATRDGARDSRRASPRDGDGDGARDEQRTSRGDGPEIRSVSVTPPRPVPSRPVPSRERETRPHGDSDDSDEPDLSAENGRWGAWQMWKERANKPLDPPAHRDDLERAWQAVDRELAAKLGEHPHAAFERLLRAYLSWEDGRPLPGGKVAPRGHRPASWLPSGVYQLAEHLLTKAGDGQGATRLRAESERHRQARIAAGLVDA